MIFRGVLVSLGNWKAVSLDGKHFVVLGFDIALNDIHITVGDFASD